MISNDERAAIQSAVRNAEAGISGEIVPCIVDSSDGYSIARWKAGAFVAALTWITLFFVEWYDPALIPIDPLIAYGLIPLLAAVAGAASGFCPPLVRFFTGRDEIAERVHGRAKQAFLEYEVFQTRRRTGVLIFVSLLEHRVVVLGDSGINAKVKSGEWDGIIQAILKGPSIAQGIVDGIGRARELLLKHGFSAAEDDPNEISDHPRT